MPQVNVRLTDESVSIVNAHKEKIGAKSFTDAINDLIVNATKMNEEQMRTFVEGQDKLNAKLLSLLEGLREEVDIESTARPIARQVRKICIEGKVYGSVSEASSILGLSQSDICHLIKIRPHTHFYTNA